jgi:anti-sigma factor RsiW
MIRRPRRARAVVCRDLVEQLTQLLDGALPERTRRRVDAHLEGCADCTRAVAQWRDVVTLVGRLRPD